MQTIADFFLSNPSNNTQSKQDFESDLVYDEILTDASPTLVYRKGSNLIAWYEIESNLGYK